MELLLREIRFHSISPPPYLLDDVAERNLETHEHHLAGNSQPLPLSVIGILTLNLKCTVYLSVVIDFNYIISRLYCNWASKQTGQCCE